MSRSYKKNPIIKYAGDKKMKKAFARRMRRVFKHEDIGDGARYKRYNNPWEIADVTCYCSWEEFKSWPWTQGMSEEKAWAEWKRIYYSK